MPDFNSTLELIESTILGLLPELHFPKSKNKPYVRLRDSVSAKYGIITTITTLVIVLSLPVMHYIYIKYLYKVFDSSRSSRNVFMRNVVHNFLYHYLTIKTIAFWGVVLCVLTFMELHQDLIFLAKRLGRVSTVCLTTVLFLSLRSSPLPDILYLSLIPMHKWLARMIIVQGLAHTLIYLAYFNHKNTWNKLYKSENLYGVAAMFGFLVILVTSVSQMRKWSYRLFYINHYIWTWVIVICLQFHARPGIGPYTIANGLILIYQVVYRIFHTRSTKVNVISISPNISIVTLPNDALTSTCMLPGGHIRLAEFKSNFISRFLLNLSPLYHPYTLASLPSDKTQKLIIRKTTFQLSNNKKYLITGSFSPMLSFISPKKFNSSLYGVRSQSYVRLPFITSQSSKFNINMKVDAEKVLIIVGGSAISFALPILRVLNYNGIGCKLIWVIRDLRDIKVLKFFPSAGDCIDVYVTVDIETTMKRPSFQDILNTPASSSGGFKNYGSINSLADETSFSDDYENRISEVDINLENETENVEIDFTDNCDFKSSDDGGAMALGTVNDLNIPEVAADDTLEIEYADSSIETIGAILPKKVDQEPSPTQNQHQHLNDNIHSHNLSPFTTKEQDYTTNPHLKNMQSRNEVLCHIPAMIRPYIPEGVQVFKGRPKLGSSYYDWCVDESCVGPVEVNGNTMCCRDMKKNIVRSEDDEGKANSDKKKKVWVVGAGPSGLVSNVSLWAKDHGFHFHAESFSV